MIMAKESEGCFAKIEEEQQRKVEHRHHAAEGTQLYEILMYHAWLTVHAFLRALLHKCKVSSFL